MMILFFWFLVTKCKPEDVIPPDHASVQCTNPYGNFSYDSQCEYSCEEGYELKGSNTTRCTSTTEWSSKPPACERELNLPFKIKMTHLIRCDAFFNILTSFCSCSMSRADRTTERQNAVSASNRHLQLPIHLWVYVWRRIQSARLQLL